MVQRKNPDTLWRVKKDSEIGMREYRSRLKHEARSDKPQHGSPTHLGRVSLESTPMWDLKRATSAQLGEAIIEHYQKNSSYYYELAVIQAHIEGIELNLEKPLVIGSSEQAT